MVAALLLAPTAARAATYSWGVSSGDWSLPANWGGTLPTSADTAAIANGGTATVTLTGEVCNTLWLGGTTGAGALQMTAGSSLSATTEYVGYSGTGTFTQSGGTNSVSNLTLGQTWGSSNGTYNLNGGTLIVSGGIYKGSGTAAFNFNGGTLLTGSNFLASLPIALATAGSNVTIDTAGYPLPTLAGSLSGPGGLIKADSGKLTLSAANTFSGPTLVTGGTLSLANSGALQNSTVTVNATNGLAFSNAGTYLVGALAGSGGFALNSGVALSVGADGASTSFSGALSGSGSLAKIGSGVLTLTGSNTYTGGTSVNGGTLLLDFSAAGAPAGNIINFSADSSALTLGGGTLSIQSASGGTSSQQFNGLTLAADASTIRLNKNGNSNLPSLSLGTLTATTTASAGGTLLLDTSAGGTITTTTPATNGIYGGRIVYYDGTGYDWATSSGTSTYTLSKAATTTTLPASGAIAGTNYFLAGNGSVTLSETANTLKLSPTAASTSLTISSGSLTLAAGGLLFTGTNDYRVSGGSITAGNGSGAYELIVEQYAANNSLTIASVLANNGTNATSLTKAGPGTLTLSATNSYSGGTSVLAGTLALSGSIGGSTVQVGESGAATLIQSVTNSVDSVSSALYLGYNPGGSGAYTLIGGSLGLSSTAGGLFAGYNGTGSFTQSAGTTTVAGSLSLGTNFGSSGSYSLSGGSLGLSPSAALYVGNSGTGTFTQSGGTVAVGTAASAGNVYLGHNAGSNGTYYLNGGSLTLASTAGVLYLGSSGTGTLSQSGGINTVSGSLDLGYYAGSSGTYNLSNTGVLSAASLYLGNFGTGTFWQTGGTNTVAGAVYVGYNTGGSGTYNLSGGSLSLSSTAGYLYVGYLTPGTFTQSGGTNTVANILCVGYEGSGTYTLNAGTLALTSTTTGAKLWVGDYAAGNFTQSGGITTIAAGNVLLGSSSAGGTCSISGGSLSLNSTSSTLYLGFNNGGSGTCNLSSTGYLSAPTEYVGYSGTGTFTQTGGTNSVSKSLYVGYGYAYSDSGSYNLSGGSLAVTSTAGGLLMGYYSALGTGNFTQSGGTATVAGALGIYSGSSYALSNGQLSAGTETVGTALSRGTFTQTGGSNAAGSLSIGTSGTYTLTAGTLAVTGAISGSGPLVVNGGAWSAAGGITAPLVLASASTSSLTYSLGSAAQLSSVTYVGQSGAASLAQSAGTQSAGTLYFGFNPGATGNYSLTGGTLAVTSNEYLGYSGTGGFIQSAGAHTGGASGGLYLGYNAGSSGTYNLTGGSLSGFGSETVGCSGTGSFTQSGGTNTDFSISLGLNPGSSGTYALSGGSLSIPPAYGGLYVGGSGSGTFKLSQAGTLSAAREFVGYNTTATDLFQQTGGINTVNYLSIGGSNDRYLLSGGTLQINGGLANAGTLDFGSGGGVLSIAASSLVDFSQGTIANAGSTALTIPAGSLLIVSSSFNSAVFHTFTNNGMIHTSGSTLTVAAGQGFGGWGTINDPVSCQGWITAGYSINLMGSLSISGAGNVNLGEGGVFTNDPASEILGGSLTSSYHYVGYGGAGTFTQSGGSNTTGVLILGNNSGDNGSYTLNGTGLLSASTEYLGNSGTGSFTQSGGTNTASYTLFLGLGTGSSGTYTLNAGSLSLPASSSAILYVGYDGTGTFSQTGGTVVAPSAVYLGYDAGSSGTYNFNGGALSFPSTASSYLYVGYSGTGNFSQSTGTVAPGYLYLGNSSGSSGFYTLSSTGLLSAVEAEYIGYSGTGSFTQSGGTNTSYAVYLGYNAGFPGYYATSNGTYNLTAGLLSLPSSYWGLYVGYSGTGNFTQSGGTTTVAGSVYLGYNSGSSGTYSLSGGSLSVSSTSGGLYVGYSGTGSFTQSGGTANVSSLILGYYPALGYSTGSSGTYNLNGGTLIVSSISGGSGTFAFNFNGGTVQAGTNFSAGLPIVLATSGGNGTINTAGYALTFSGQFSGPGGLIKAGSGTLTLGASNGPSNTFSGTTLISGGTLTLANSGALLESTLDTSGGGKLSFGSLTAATLGGLTSGGTLANGITLSVGNNSLSTTYSGVLSGVGGLVKIGGGVLTLSGSNTYTGGTSVNSGTLLLDFSAGSAPASNIINYTNNLSALTLGGGTLAIQSTASGAANTQRFNGLTLAADANTIRLNKNGNSNLPSLFLGAITATTAGSTLLLDTSGGGTLTTAGGTANGIYGGGRIVYYNGTDYYWATSTSTATPYTISGATTTTTLPPSGATGTTNYFLASNGSVTASETANTLKLSPTAAGTSLAISSSQVLTLNTGGLLFTGSNDYTISGGSITASNGSGFYQMILQQYAANNNLTIASAVSNSAVSLIKTGPGTVTLAATNNSYSGGTSVLAGTLALSGSIAGGTVLVGESGTGSFSQSGTNSVSNALYLGYNPAGSGSYSLTGGSLGLSSTAGGLYVGYSGTGNFTQSAGTTAVAGSLCVGTNVGSNGTYTLNGGSLGLSSTAGGPYVGYNGTGNFTQSGGTVAVGTTASAGTLYLGYNAGSNGTYNLSGGSLSLNPTGSGTLYLAYNPGSSGTFNLTNAGYLSAPSEWVGYSGAGSFAQSGGTNNISGNLYLSSDPSSSNGGSYNLSGTGLVLAPSQYVGYEGNGSFTQSGGTNAVSGALYVGESGNGTYTLNGGSLSIADSTQGLYVGDSRTVGTFTQSGGVNNVAGGLYLASVIYGAGTYNLNGGTLIVSAIIPGSDGGGALNLGSGTLQAGATFSTTIPITLTASGGYATIDTAGYTLTLSGALSGPGGLIKTDNGTLVLAAANTFSGPTLISGGTLTLSNPAALQQSTVYVYTANGLAFSGGGTYFLGALAGGGGFALNSGVTLSVGADGASTSFSGALSGSGSLAKTGTGTLTLSGSNSYRGGTSVTNGVVVAENQSAIPSGSLLSIGASGSVVLGARGAAEPLDLLSGGAGPLGSQPSTSGTAQVTPALSGGVSPVPEPGTLALLAAAAACALGVRRSRHKG
jgi:autotransporter-associated beta strand protein